MTTTTGTNGVNQASATQTSRGTKIAAKANSLDKNAFLKILTTELTNQNPDNNQDASAYVSQLAQFSSLEQMSNLNTNMALYSANSMIGKGVVLSDLNASGNQFSGIVRSVSKTGSNIVLNVDTGDGTTNSIKQFAYENVVGVTNNPYETTQISSNELSLMAEASLIGKSAQFNQKDSSGNYYAGVIKGIVNNSGVLNLSVLLNDAKTTKTFTLDQLLNLTAGS